MKKYIYIFALLIFAVINFSACTDDMEDLKKQIAELQQALSSVKGDVNGLKDNKTDTVTISSLETAIDEIQAKLSLLENIETPEGTDISGILLEFSKLKGEVEDLKNKAPEEVDLSGINTTIDGILERLKTLETTEPTTPTDLTEINKQLADLAADVEILKNKAPEATTPTDLSALNEALNALKSRVAALENKEPTSPSTPTDISAITEALNALKSRVAALENKESTTPTTPTPTEPTDLSDIKETIDRLETEIKTLVSKAELQNELSNINSLLGTQLTSEQLNTLIVLTEIENIKDKINGSASQSYLDSKLTEINDNLGTKLTSDQLATLIALTEISDIKNKINGSVSKAYLDDELKKVNDNLGTKLTNEQLAAIASIAGINTNLGTLKDRIDALEKQPAINSQYKVLQATESLLEEVQRGYSVINLIPSETYIWDDIVLENIQNLTINGNGATVKPSDLNKGCLSIINCNNLTLDNIKFIGTTENVGGDCSANGAQKYMMDHWALKYSKGYNNKVNNCYFHNWRGGAIAMTASNSSSGSSASETDNYYNYGMRIQNNLFDRCCFGRVNVGRFEFGIDYGNRYYNCACGVYDEAGNWSTLVGKFTACYNPYVCESRSGLGVNIRINGVWFDGPSNTAHGTVVGCEFNHSTSGGGCSWSASVGGFLRNLNSGAINAAALGANNGNTKGIIFLGVIPPTFTGNTLYYCNITGKDTQEARTVFTGNVMTSDCTIEHLNQTNKWYVVGHSYHTGATLKNVISLDEKIMNTLTTSDLDGINTQLDDVNLLIESLKAAITALGGTIPEPVYKWRNIVSSDAQQYGTAATTINSGSVMLPNSQAGILLNKNIRGVKFKVGATQNKPFQLICSTTQNPVANTRTDTRSILINWATGSYNKWFNSNTDAANQPFSEVNGLSGTVRQNCLIAEGANVEIQYFGGKIELKVSYDDGSAYKGKGGTFTLQNVTGDIRFGFCGYAGNASEAITNVQVYVLDMGK